jgi:hypothetical protein
MFSKGVDDVLRAKPQPQSLVERREDLDLVKGALDAFFAQHAEFDLREDGSSPEDGDDLDPRFRVSGGKHACSFEVFGTRLAT